jgi:hypothetical protein
MKQASLCLILVGLVASGARAQSLGDAAKKEKQRRDTAAKPPQKVISDDDLGRYATGPAAEGEDASVPQSPPESQAVPSSPSDAERPAPTGRRPQASPPNALSGMDELKAKIDRWRARYRPVKARVDTLEAEIRDLEPKAKGITIVLGPSDPRYVAGGTPQKTQAESALTRLGQARNELRRAKQELASIEEGARKDGVSGGSLY